MSDRREYRYRPAATPGPCSDHPGCVVICCHRFLCPNLVHRRLDRPGQPRRYCSNACRVAEHRRLRA